MSNLDKLIAADEALQRLIIEEKCRQWGKGHEEQRAKYYAELEEMPAHLRAFAELVESTIATNFKDIGNYAQYFIGEDA